MKIQTHCANSPNINSIFKKCHNIRGF